MADQGLSGVSDATSFHLVSGRLRRLGLDDALCGKVIATAARMDALAFLADEPSDDLVRAFAVSLSTDVASATPPSQREAARNAGGGEDVANTEGARVLGFNLKLENLIATARADFLGATTETLHESVNSALQALGEAAEVERAYLFLFRQDLATLGPAFEWCAEGVKRHALEQYDGVAVTEFPWSMGHFVNDVPVHVTDAAQLPDGAAFERKMCESMNVMAYINIPVFVEAVGLVGWLGFDSVFRHREWGDEVAMLKVVGVAISEAIWRAQNAEPDGPGGSPAATANDEPLMSADVILRHLAAGQRPVWRSGSQLGPDEVGDFVEAMLTQEDVPVFVVRTDEMVIEAGNEAFVDLMSLPRENFGSLSYWAIVHPDERDQHNMFFQKFDEEGRPYKYHFVKRFMSREGFVVSTWCQLTFVSGTQAMLTTHPLGDAMDASDGSLFDASNGSEFDTVDMDYSITIDRDALEDMVTTTLGVDTSMGFVRYSSLPSRSAVIVSSAPGSSTSSAAPSSSGSHPPTSGGSFGPNSGGSFGPNSGGSFGPNSGGASSCSAFMYDGDGSSTTVSFDISVEWT